MATIIAQLSKKSFSNRSGHYNACFLFIDGVLLQDFALGSPYRYILNPGLGREVVNAALLHFLAAENTVEHICYGSQLSSSVPRVFKKLSEKIVALSHKPVMENKEKHLKLCRHGGIGAWRMATDGNCGSS